MHTYIHLGYGFENGMASKPPSHFSRTERFFHYCRCVYALSKGVHIRADFVYRDWSVKTQATIDLTLYLLFYFPGIIGAAWACYKYAYKSWSIMERGMDTAWMPLMWPIKFALFIGFIFLLIQGISEILKCIYALKNRRWP